MTAFDIRIGWRTPGQYYPVSQWCLSFYQTPKMWRTNCGSATFIVIGFYIQFCLYSHSKTGPEVDLDMDGIVVGSTQSIIYAQKNAEFTKAPADSVFYCYITTADGVKHAFTVSESRLLSRMGDPGPRKFRKWLEGQDDPIVETCED